MTNYINELLFDVFLSSLNKGLIFKDSNIYTQLSKNAEMVVQFYQNYFRNECVDLAGDLRDMFKGVVRTISHPQMILVSLSIMSKTYTTDTSVGFLGNDELRLLFEIINNYFMETLFSSRYLCFKFMLQMVTLYINLS